MAGRVDLQVLPSPLRHVSDGNSLVLLNPAHLCLKLQLTMSRVLPVTRFFESFERWKMVCRKLLSVLKSGLLFNKANQTHTKDGRFMVPLPKQENAKPLGESRSPTIQSFLSLERNLHSKNQFQEFGAVMK